MQYSRQQFYSFAEFYCANANQVHHCTVFVTFRRQSIQNYRSLRMLLSAFLLIFGRLNLAAFTYLHTQTQKISD